MKNPTVRGNLALIKELQRQQEFTADTLGTVLEHLIRTGIAQDFLTHRGNWKETVRKLKEVKYAEDTEAGRESDDKGVD